MSKSSAKNYSKTGNARNKQATDVKDTKIAGNIFTYVVGKMKADQEAKGHSAPFPLKLATDHIISWSNEGDTILDPFMGSGTTGVACLNTNRNFIGIELDKEYFKLAQNRINPQRRKVIRRRR